MNLDEIGLHDAWEAGYCSALTDVKDLQRRVRALEDILSQHEEVAQAVANATPPRRAA